MPSLLQNIFKDWSQQHWLVWGFGLLSMLLTWAAIATGFYPLVFLPLALVVIYVGLVNFRSLFYLLIICIPLSTEIVLPNGFGTDLPTEPLMIGLMVISILYFIQQGPKVDLSFLLVTPGTGDPVAPGQVGEVVVTTLNPDYPLIRFATGDLSAVLEGESPCGRTN
ncbi:MAG: hypothetical protein AAF242_15600, partial [Bacteroidota bacterium]